MKTHIPPVITTQQVDVMLQKLEKEIDDVDAKIGNRWRLLDRYVYRSQLYGLQIALEVLSRNLKRGSSSTLSKKEEKKEKEKKKRESSTLSKKKRGSSKQSEQFLFFTEFNELLLPLLNVKEIITSLKVNIEVLYPNIYMFCQLVHLK